MLAIASSVLYFIQKIFKCWWWTVIVSATVNMQDELTSALWTYIQTVQVITTSSANIDKK